jgi:hypothetical protein
MVWDDYNYHPAQNVIIIYSLAYTIYGWDVISSCLIHEWGHHDQATQGNQREPPDWDGRIKYEMEANERGLYLAPPHLVPEDYQKHRSFFLRAYLEHGWDKERCLSEWKKYQEG